jgi:hypothetical protein
VGVEILNLSKRLTQAELMQAAIELGRQYDANYADKNSAAMAALYAPDGLLVPLANGGTHEVHGSIVAIYQRDPDGWHMRLVEPSVPEPMSK